MDKERELLSILEVCKSRLAQDVVTHIAEMAQAREWGVGFEDLCNQLYECDSRISLSIYNRIQRLGMAMELDSSSWEILAELVEE